ncbi:MAG: rhomboid family intramembrane serine protease [Eubacterium sp.]|nr:rhomboid family intramembrane serine protease [Eubacterium sp.]
MLENIVRNKICYQEDGTKRAVVSIVIIIINVLVWSVLELFGDTLSGSYIAQHGGMHPDLIIDCGEWYRLVTAMFIHFGAPHLANNMILLAAAGGRLERAVGGFKYLLIYLGAGLAGNVLSLFIMVQERDYAVCAGASGAVFGIIGALIWAAIRCRGKIEGLTAKGLIFMAVLCLYSGITTEGVDNWAHAGGAAGGFFLCMLLYRKPRMLEIL